MPRDGATPIVLDTSILLNFIKIDRLALLGQIGAPIVMLDQVRDEVRRPAQRALADDAVAQGILRPEAVTAPVEVALFAELHAGGRLGLGECAVLAVALTRDWMAGLQDRRARTEGQRRRPSLSVCQTEDLMISLIRSGVLALDEADGMLVAWAAKHRFKSRLSSFRDLL